MTEVIITPVPGPGTFLVESGPTGPQGQAGADGLSAYQVAVANGFVGTEAQWLASLVGADGNDGRSVALFVQTDPPLGAMDGDIWIIP